MSDPTGNDTVVEEKKVAPKKGSSKKPKKKKSTKAKSGESKSTSKKPKAKDNTKPKVEDGSEDTAAVPQDQTKKASKKKKKKSTGKSSAVKKAEAAATAPTQSRSRPSTRGLPTGRSMASAKSAGSKKGSTKKKSRKGKKKKKKIVEDPKLVREMCDLAAAGNLDRLRQLAEDELNMKRYDWKQGAGEALIRAAERGHIMVALYLLDAGCDVNMESGKPVQRACALNQYPMVQKLVDVGGDVRMKTPFTEYTPLHFAARTGNVYLVDFLIKMGADIDAVAHSENCATYNGWSPLHIAADAGHLNVVRYLVECRAEIDLKTTSGDTAAAVAAEHGHFEIVRYLVSEGADFKATRRQLSLIQWAAYRCSDLTVHYLASWGAVLDMNFHAEWFPEGLTLSHILQAQFSQPVYSKVDLANYRGKEALRERSAHKRILGELRWESPEVVPDDDPAIMAALNTGGFDPAAMLTGAFGGQSVTLEAPPPEIRQFPPEIINLISSCEL